MTMFARPAAAEAAPSEPAPPAAAAAPAKRPPAWSPSNWPVRWKVLAIVLVPLVLATVFGALRIKDEMADSAGLKLAAARADVVPVLTKYMSALDVALLASSTGRDADGAKRNYEARKSELQTRLDDTDVSADVRTGVTNLLDGGQLLVNKAADPALGLRERVTLYAPILLTAENVINASVRVDDEKVRTQAQGLSRAVGARGQMTMQKILVTRGGELPEPQLRTAMITLAGTEPSTLFGMTEVLGAGSADAKTLQQQLVSRMAIMSDPASVLVDNADLLRSLQTTDDIAAQVIQDASAAVTRSVHAQAAERRDAAVLDATVVLVAIAIAVIVVLLVARALVRPLRVLRDGALRVAHTDLEAEIARVKAGGAEPTPEPLPVYTTEEIGQVAHAVDELHTQALLLAGDEARLRRGRLLRYLGDAAGPRVAARQQRDRGAGAVAGGRLVGLRGFLRPALVPAGRVRLRRRRVGTAAGELGAGRGDGPDVAGPGVLRGALEHLGRQVDLRGGAGARFVRGGAAQPHPDAVPGGDPADDDVIYRRMLSELMGDPHDLVNSPDLDWQSVWDRGWTLAAAAEDKPVEHTTDHGLPVRTPGARLVPGGTPGSGQPAQARSEADAPAGREPQHAAAARDPEAVRASFTSHFGGVRSGRSHARENGTDPQ
ncbi:HAMP domain-containing protein [Mycobacterium sp. E1319]|uniref:HAMP domain-containing protein n=1 Tax=Mycobacterium sp. E1319 TaxID=1834124 RepID=UPI000B04147A|nr:HAMP domain-containing protein [Mycobacterium sp. E1319]